MEVLISKAFIDLVISYDEFVLVSNAPKEFYGLKEEIRHSSDK